MKLEALGELTASLFAPAWKWIVASGAAALAFVLPTGFQRDMALSCAAFIVLDTGTGMMAAWQTGNPISSARFSRVLAKLFGYGSVVIVSSVASKFLTNGSDLGKAGVIGVMSLVLTTEGISILENVRKMGLKFPAFLETMLKGKQAPEEN